jgi:hypothetical protein
MLIAVYWCAVYVQLPVAVEFDPRSPTEIQNAYKIGVTAKNRRLKWTVALSIIATIFVAFALVWNTIGPKPPLTAPWFTASLHAQAKTHLLALTGEIGMAGVSTEMQISNKVIVRIQPTVSYAGLKTTNEYALIPFGERGQLQASLPLSFSSDSVDVTLEWTDWRGTTIQLSQLVTGWQQVAPVLMDSTQMR